MPPSCQAREYRLGLGVNHSGHQADLAGLVQALQGRRDLPGTLVFAPDRLHHSQAAAAL